ncbi:Abi family protein [Lactobacillus amylovorus]|jgi:abortive infection bacteriophage resistance protein|uniref:Abi family protein n=1 Tax=Lactobacillus amylovorus TaxID=1604 RepID=UPI001F486455|nr:Abi family protein [Lactobacillus amylovorus]UIK34877.1 Abi family protein [Lactobacillus amylovorus]
MENNDRPFRTLEEQVNLLREKGIIIQNINYAKNELMKRGYYSLINGYKSLFLERNENVSPRIPHQYIAGTKFEDFVNLYEFDKKLRAILYNGLLSYEVSLGAELAYRFSEAFPKEYSYLDINNFNHNDDNTVQVLKTISSLANKIEQESHNRGSNAIRHYLNNHNCIPLWVLTEFMTFGDLNYFYLNCKEEIRQGISHDFTQRYRITYNLRRTNAIMPEIIEHINHMVNMFRNAVAHNEITYSKVINRGPNMRSIRNVLGQTGLPISSQPGVFELIVSLRLVLDKSEYATMSDSIKKLLTDADNQFSTQVYEKILSCMHFPNNYEHWI